MRSKVFRQKALSESANNFAFRPAQMVTKFGKESFKAMPLWSGWMIWQKINYIHANPVKAGLVKSAKDYPWSSFRSFYSQDDQSLAVDHDWSWPDDVEKLSQAIKQMGWHR